MLDRLEILVIQWADSLWPKHWSLDTRCVLTGVLFAVLVTLAGVAVVLLV